MELNINFEKWCKLCDWSKPTLKNQLECLKDQEALNSSHFGCKDRISCPEKNNYFYLTVDLQIPKK